MTAGIHGTEVDTRGLLDVLGENLYSTPQVAIRELVQNAHDSCIRRRLEDSKLTTEPRIDVEADSGRGTLTIRDTGAGLTREEVQRYLATIGSGYTRILRQSSDDRSLVGAFGLGFLSAYVVSESVEVMTSSYQEPGTTWIFRSRDGLRYSLTEGPRRDTGTSVHLKLKKHHQDLAGPNFVANVLARYCRLLPTPIYAPQQINADPPSWRCDPNLPPLRRRQLHLETARSFEMYFDPLCAWKIEPTESFDIQGLLWLQDGGSWATSDNRRVSIFVRGMLVDDDASKALPEWAGFAGAAIECDALTPTASRESIKDDASWAQLQAHLQEALVQGLMKIAQTQPEVWRRVLARHNEALRAATLAEDPLFDLLEGELRLPTSEGDLRIKDVERATPGRVLLSVGDDAGYEELIHRALSQPILKGTLFGVSAFAKRWCQAHGKKLVTLGTRTGNEEVFELAHPDPERDAWLEELFGAADLTVVAAHFLPMTLPLVFVPDRDVELKKRIEDDAADQRMSAGILGLARQFTSKIEGKDAARLFVNLDCKLIHQLRTADDERAKAGANVLQALAHLSTRGGTVHGKNLGEALGTLCGAVETLLES